MKSQQECQDIRKQQINSCRKTQQNTHAQTNAVRQTVEKPQTSLKL